MRSPGRSEELQVGDFPQNGVMGNLSILKFSDLFQVLLLVVVFFRHEKLSFFFEGTSKTEGTSLKRDGC